MQKIEIEKKPKRAHVRWIKTLSSKPKPETRIKKDINGVIANYWTRTHRSGLTYRLVDIRPDGTLGSSGSEGLSVRRSAKVLFGICI